MNLNEKECVLSVKDLTVSFKTDRGIVRAVRGVSFDLYKGETLCIVGESGSGKSVTNKAIMGISAKNAVIDSGNIYYEGEDLVKVSEEEFHRIRGHKIGMIFQDPLSALNPVMKIGKQITEATLINKNILKRRYSELISKELIAFRNNEANFSFNEQKILNQISKHSKIQEQVQEFDKEIEKCNLKLAKDSKLKAEKIEELNASIKDAATNKEKLFSELLDYLIVFKRDYDNQIIQIKAQISELEANKKEAELDEEIRLTALQNLKEELEFIENNILIEISKDSFETIFKYFNEIEINLKNFIKIYKKHFKSLNKPLKKSLDLSKKSAKANVKEYKNEITKEFNENLDALKLELANAQKELDNYINSLSESKKEEVLSIKEHNAKTQKMILAESKKFHDANISKTTNENKLELKEMTDPKVKELDQTILDLNKKIDELKEEFINKTKITKKEAKRMALKVMSEVGIPMPERRFKQYPFEFSGGMRQRIVIAIALTANPDILICDEPTTALDVTIQAQILELINNLKKTRNLSCIFITHDLGVVANMADRVAVMYAGKIVEYGTAYEVFFDPRHPYTWALLSSIPDVDSKEKLEAIPGTPPDMIYPPVGDAFALRNKHALAIDFKYQPPFFKISDTHYAATWLLYPDAPKVEMPKIVKERIRIALNGRTLEELETSKEVN